MKRVLLTVLLLCAASFGQAGFSYVAGAPANCGSGTPHFIFDYVNNVLYGCPKNGGAPGLNAPLGHKFQAATSASASFNLPAGVAPSAPVAGDFWNTTAQRVPSFAEVANNTTRIVGTISVLGAAGNSTVINTATALNGSSVSMPAALMNVVGKTLRIQAYGTYSITTSTPTLAIAIKIGSTTLCTATSSATTNGASTLPWYFTGFVTTAATGASGNDESHCKLEVALGASNTGTTGFIDNNTAVSSNYDHTAANAITLVGTAAGASNAAQLRTYTVELMN